MKLVNVKKQNKNDSIFTVDKAILAKSALTKLGKASLALVTPFIISMVKDYANKHLLYQTTIKSKLEMNSVTRRYFLNRGYSSNSILTSLSYIYLQNPSKYKFNASISSIEESSDETPEIIRNILKKETMVSFPEECINYVKHSKYNAYIIYRFSLNENNSNLTQSDEPIFYTQAILDILIVGPDFLKVKNEYSKFIQKTENRTNINSNYITINNNSYNAPTGMVLVSPNIVTCKRWTDIIIDEDVKNSIINQFESFFKMKDTYKERGWNHNLNVLFKGPAGTGKTSLCNIIFSYFFKYNQSSVLSSDVFGCYNTLKAKEIKYFNYFFPEINNPLKDMNRYTFLVIEELDTIMNDKDSVETLMHIMSGPLSRDKFILIGNTNFPDKIDHRIIERFHINETIGYMSKDNTIKLCKKYDLDDEHIDYILSEFKIVDENNKEGYIPRVIENAIKKYESRKFTYNNEFNKSLKEESFEVEDK